MELEVAFPLLRVLLCLSGLLLSQADECSNNVTVTGGLGNWETEDGQLLSLVVRPGDSPDCLLLQWEKPTPNVLSYSIVIYEVATDVVKTNISVGQEASSYELRGLVPGTQYEIQVKAVSECSGSPAQRVSAWTNPLAVHNVRLKSGETPGELAASWEEPLGGNEGYQLTLYHTKSNEAVRNESLQKGVSTYQFQSLESGSEYTLEIATLSGPYRSSARASEWTYPLAVHNVRLKSGETPGELSASWEEPLGGNKGYQLTLYHTKSNEAVRNESLQKGVSTYQFQSLESGSEYTLEIATLSGPYRSSARASEWTYPLAVYNLRLKSGETPGELSASWEEPLGGNEGYQLTLYHTKSDEAVRNESLQKGVSTYQFKGLESGSEYTLEIATLSGPYRSSARASEWTYPLAVHNVRLKSGENPGELSASWEEPLGSNEGYQLTLYHTKSDEAVRNESLQKGVSTYQFQGLESGSEYTLEIAMLSGPYRSSVRASEWTYPLAVHNVRLESGKTPGELSASWEDPLGGNEGYQLTLYHTKSDEAVRNESLHKGISTYQFQGLESGSEYTLEIATLSGPYRSSARASEWTYPLAVYNVRLESGKTPGGLSASWEEPLGGNEGYELTLYHTKSDEAVRNESLQKGISKHQFQGLESGSEYTLEIATLSGPHRSSARASEWTYPLAPHNVSLRNTINPQELSASWSEPPGGAEGYKLVLYHVKSATVARNKSLGEDLTTYHFHDLDPGSEYMLDIATFSGPYHNSTSVSEWTRPLPPSKVTLHNPGSSSSLVAAWDNAFGAAWFYLNLHSVVSQAVTQAVSAERGVHEHTFQDLTPGTQYCLVITAVSGPYGTPGLNATDWTYPLAPSNISLKSSWNATTLQAVWTKAAGERQSYEVILYSAESGVLEKNMSIGGNVTDVEVEGLKPGTQYTVRVAAVAGPYQSTSDEAAAWTYPFPPSGLSLSSQGSLSSLFAHWNPARGSSYVTRLYSAETNQLLHNRCLGREVTNITYSSLTAGTQYLFEISTVAGPHTSAPQYATEWTHPLAPEQVTLLTEENSSILRASWRVPPVGASCTHRIGLSETESQILVRNTTDNRNTTELRFDGLIPGRQYSLQISTQAGSYNSPTLTASNWTYPSVPCNVTLANLGESSILYASWEKPQGDHDGFTIQLYSSEQRLARNASIGPSELNMTLDGLQPGSRYTLAVSAVSGPYTSLAATDKEWTYPLHPTLLKVENDHSPSSLGVSWTLVDGGGDLWLLLYTDHSWLPVQNVSLEPGVTNFTVDGLHPGTRYYLQVVSQAGPYLTASPRVTGYTYPLAPPSLKVTSGGPNSLVVDWEKPAGDREGYSLSISKAGVDTALNLFSTDKNSTRATFTDLVPGTWYTVQIQAVTGTHFTSTIQDFTTCTEPLPPIDVNLTNGGSTTMLHATWTAPAGERDSYRLILLSIPDQEVLRDISVANNQTFFTFKGLSAGSQYIMKIAAMCQEHKSFSPNFTEWTYPVAPSNLTLMNLGSPSSLHASWQESKGWREKYMVILYDASSGSVAWNTSVVKATKEYTFQNLRPGNHYSAEVSAFAGPYRANTWNVTNATCPFAPLRVNLRNTGHSNRLHASWDAAEGERDGYEAILYNMKLNTIAGMASLDGSTRSYAFTGLTAGSEYMVQIAAFTGTCRNFSSNVTEWTHPLASPQVFMENEGSHDMLRVIWEEPTGVRDRYTLALYDERGHVVTEEASIEDDVRNYTFYGLNPGSKYRVELVSVAGPYRMFAANITDWTYPLAPSGVQVNNLGSTNNLHVFWEDVEGERDSYLVILYDSPANHIKKRASVGRGTHNYTFSGLTSGSKYSVEISAIAGPYASPAAIVSDWTYPLAPRKVSATNKANSYRLQALWDHAAGERDAYVALLYDARSGTISRKATLGKHSRDFLFSRLTPGNKYNIELAAKAGPYSTSAENVTDWTYPLAPQNVSVVIEENNTVLVLSWSRSGGILDHYNAWLLDLWDQTATKNQTLGKEESQHAFQGLVPGRNYSVSVSSVVGPYHNSSRRSLVPVEPNPVTSPLCWSNETGLYLNWSQPREDTDSCWLEVEKLSERIRIPVLSMMTMEREASMRNLAPNTSYQIGLTLLGSNGMRSRTVTLLCNTSPEVLPPPPSDRAPVFDMDSGVIISSDMFSEENGRIEYFGVIVTSNTSLSRPTQQITNCTWYDHFYGHKDTYLAVLVPNPFQPRGRDAAVRTTWAIPVGTEECSQTREICNGKLKADTQYRFSVAAFTRYDALDPAVSFSAFSAPPNDGNSNPVPIPVVAGVVGGVLLTSMVFLVLVFWRRSRLRRLKKNNPTQEMTTYSLRNIHRTIPVQNFKQVYDMKAANASQGFFQEFEELKEVGKDQSKLEAELPDNIAKNRYPHVLPYDNSRVKLSLIGEEPASDYINANFIPGYVGYQEYICTQGPLRKTIDDFWRLIWEYNVRNIVMLTVCMENGRVLCDHYWPTDGSPISYGQINVRLVAQDVSSEWTTREFRLWHDALKLERDVHQLHYTAWPDHGLPESSTSMMYFAELVQEHIQAAKGSGPTVVHSSAGVGRTGTFICLDRLLQQMKHERVVDVFHTVYTMRLSRYLMVQTLRQYIFLHTCILDKITEEQLAGLGDKETSRPILQKTFTQHYLKKSANGNAGFLHEYQVLLEAAKDEVGADLAAAALVNQQTHSYPSVLPYDRCRVKFSAVGPDPLSDAAKAWFIPGFNSAKDYLAVHGPEEDTIEQFWRMAWEHNVHTIVTLVPFGEDDELPECWPMDASPICSGSVTVHLAAMKSMMGWKCTHLKIKHEKKTKERLIHRFHFPLWNDEDEPNGESIIKFLVALRQSAPGRKRSAPLLIHCSAGVGQMGIVLALDCLLHQAKTEKSVDVYGVTLRIAKSCCFMTPTLDQYVFLHTCLKNVLSEKQS
ncbi:receptor-type tyrosine-protein phosphatase V-like [Lissotriton helveticus]